MIAPTESEGGGGDVRGERRLREIAILTQLRQWDRECHDIQASLVAIRQRIEAQLTAWDRILPDAVANPVGLIIDLAAAEFEVAYDAVLGRGRPAQVAAARQVAMAIAYDLLPLSETEIGQAFGRSHGAILHARRQVADQASVDPTFRRRLDRVRSRARASIRNTKPQPTS